MPRALPPDGAQGLAERLPRPDPVPSRVAPSYWRQLTALPEDLSRKVLQLVGNEHLVALVACLKQEMAGHCRDFMCARKTLQERTQAELHWRLAAEVYHLTTAWENWGPALTQRFYAAALQPQPESRRAMPPALVNLSFTTVVLVDNSMSMDSSLQKEMLTGLHEITTFFGKSKGFAGPLFIAPLHVPPALPRSGRRNAWAAPQIVQNTQLSMHFPRWFQEGMRRGTSPIGGAIVNRILAYQRSPVRCCGGRERPLNLLILTDGDASDLDSTAQRRHLCSLFELQNYAAWQANHVVVQAHILGQNGLENPNLPAIINNRLREGQETFCRFGEQIAAHHDFPGINFQVVTDAPKEPPQPLGARMMRGLIQRPLPAEGQSYARWPFAHLSLFNPPGLVYRAGLAPQS